MSILVVIISTNSILVKTRHNKVNNKFVKQLYLTFLILSKTTSCQTWEFKTFSYLGK